MQEEELGEAAADLPVFCQLLGGQKQGGGFWTFEYYQSFFNVDTMQVRGGVCTPVECGRVPGGHPVL